MIKNVPNKLTMLRILAVPLIVCAYYMNASHVFLVSVFLLASITDWLDGYAARYTNQITPLGSFLDPVADKLLVVAVLVILMAEYHTRWLTIPGLLIISRELFASSLREWVAKSEHEQQISVSWSAKCKTALQMFALTLLLYADNPHDIVWRIGYASLLLSVLFSLYSLVKYIKVAWPALTFGVKKE